MKLLESSHSLSSSRVTFPEWDPQASKLPESWTFKQLRASSQTWTHSYINHYFREDIMGRMCGKYVHLNLGKKFNARNIYLSIF